MKTSYPLLPGIRAIGWVPALEIPASADALAAAGVAVPVLAEVHPLRFTGEPTLEASAEPDGSGHKFTTTLTFASADPVPLHMHVAFVVVGVDGTPYIVGSGTAPYCRVKTAFTTGTTAEGPAGTTYEVAHIGKVRPPVVCTVCFDKAKPIPDS